MSKANTSFFFIILLLCFALSYASRPAPAFHEASLNIDHHQVTKVQYVSEFLWLNIRRWSKILLLLRFRIMLGNQNK